MTSWLGRLPITRTRATAGRDREVHAVPPDIHRARQRARLCGGTISTVSRAILRDQLPAAVDLFGARRVQIGEDEQIGAAARRDRAPIIQPEVFRRVERAHPDRRDRIELAFGDGHADHVVNRAIVEQIGGLAIIGAPADAAAVLRRDQRQQRAQIVGVGRLADEDHHALLQFLVRLLDGRAFVIAVESRRRCRRSGPARSNRGSDHRSRARRTLRSSPARPDRPDTRRDSSSSRPAPTPRDASSSVGEIARVQARARRLHVRRRDAA